MALTLLELVSLAGQQGEDGVASKESTWSTRLKPSVAETSDFVFPKGGKKKTIKGVDVDYFDDLFVRKDGGWEVGSPNTHEEKLVVNLKKKLQNVGTFSTMDFIAMVSPALEGSSKSHGCGKEAMEESASKELVSESHGRDEEVMENGENAPNREGEGTDEENLFLRLLRKGGPVVGRKLLASIINCTLGLQFWSAFKVLGQCGLVSSVAHPDLMQKLVEHRKADLICLCFYYVLDLTPSDILMALKFLLDKSNASSLRAFEAVRQEWRRVASAAIDVAAKRKELFLKREEAIEREFKERQDAANARRRAARERAFEKDPFAIVPAEEEPVVLRVPLYERERRLRDEMTNSNSQAISQAVVLTAAVDGFQGWETCMHALVASGQDEAVLAAIIAELEAAEAVQLLQYLRKWLDRYSKRLSRNPSPKSKAKHPIHNVPSSHQVLQWVNMVLDGQYTKCVLSSEFLPELRAIQKSVESVVAIGRKVLPLLGTIEHLRDMHPLPARRQDSAAHSDYTIEYLDIS